MSQRGVWFKKKLNGHFLRHFGTSSSMPVLDFLHGHPSVPDYVDFAEIFVEEATKRWGFDGTFAAVRPDAEATLNRMFVRHRFAFQLDAGLARQVGSPALDAFVVAPALQALARPGWEEAERSFREALHHQRGGPDERDDTLTAANAALEAALKAAGLRGDRLSSLAKSLRNSSLIPSQLGGVPEALDVLLKRSSALRDPMGDAHGKAPNSPEVPQEIADLAIYWTGAFINYLAGATR